MISKAKVIIRTVGGIAFGAACTSVVQFLTVSQAKLSHIDWHEMGQAALVGSVVAVAMHFRTPPTEQK